MAGHHQGWICMGEGVRTQILQSLLYNREMLYGKKYGGADPQLIEGELRINAVSCVFLEYELHLTVFNLN